MPKIKTQSSAKKRFKITKSGRIKRSKAFRRHCLGCKTTKNKRHLRKAGYVDSANQSQILQLLAIN